jgi:hypothetical protein
MKKIILLAIALLILWAIIAFPHTNFYLIRASGGGGELLWRNNEAYLFLYDAPDGYRLTGASLLAEPIREYFFAPAIPDSRKIAVTILHVTPSGVEHYVQNSEVAIESFTPIAGAIYAHCPGGICEWTGAQFELIKADEEHQMVGETHLSSDWNEFSDAKGWSKRKVRSTGPTETRIHGQFSIQINEQLGIFVTEGNPCSVELRRPGHSSERIWYYKRGTSIVSKSTYEGVFGVH